MNIIDKENSGNIKPYPAMVYFGVVLFLTLSGIAVSAYLSVSHYRVHTDISYSSFCAISKALNCDTVSQSPYSIFFGLPVPLWGAIGYLFLFITLLFSFDIKSKKITIFPTLLFIGAVFSTISILFAMISSFIIHSYCMMCIVTYGINFMLLFMIWLMKQRFGKNTWKAALKTDVTFWASNWYRAFKWYSPLIALAVITILLIPSYWEQTAPSSEKQVLETGVTEDGAPWIGAVKPELTIIEYADYMCFQCKKMHFFLRSLVSKHPDKIRIIHKHFPLDKKFNTSLTDDLHPGSGILSSIAIFAAKENKFWQLNDYLYNYNMGNRAIYLRKIAEESGLDLDQMKIGIHSREVRIKLQRDIVIGLTKNINATPTYIIEGNIYVGQVPADILKPFTK